MEQLLSQQLDRSEALRSEQTDRWQALHRSGHKSPDWWTEDLLWNDPRPIITLLSLVQLYCSSYR